MANHFILKKNDTLPWMNAQLLASGVPIDLTGVDSIRFLARLDAKGGGNDKFLDKTATVIDATLGKVRVVWTSFDSDTAGTFACEFELTWDPGYIQTIPNDSYFNLIIFEDLG